MLTQKPIDFYQSGIENWMNKWEPDVLRVFTSLIKNKNLLKLHQFEYNVKKKQKKKTTLLDGWFPNITPF